MKDDVNAEIHWPLQVGRHKSVIANNARAMLVRNLGNGSKIGNYHYGISWSFNKEHARVRTYRRLYVLGAGRVNETELDSVVSQDAREQAKRAAISVIGDNHM